MWCRVLLVVIALTCTFQRTILAEPDGQSTQQVDQIKDVLCVIYLSGLQKEDLGVELLQKLQRHNVNIADIYNENTIKNCVRDSSADRHENTSTSAENALSTTSEQSNQTNPNGRRENFKSVRIAKASQHPNNNNQNQNIQNSTSSVKRDLLQSNVEKFIDFWMANNKAKPQKNEDTNNRTDKNKTELARTIKSNKLNWLTSDVKLINELLESYISTKQFVTTTLNPTPTQNEIDIKSQEAKDVFTNQYLIKIKNNNNTNASERSSKADESLLSKNDTIANGLLREIKQQNECLNCKSNDKTKNTSKAIQTSDGLKQILIALNREIEMDSQSMDINYIKKMFDCYVAARLQLATTIKPISTPEDVDNNGSRKLVSETFENRDLVNNPHSITDKESFTSKTDTILNEFLRQKYQSNNFNLLKSNLDKKVLRQNSRVVPTTSNSKDLKETFLSDATGIDFKSINLELLTKMFECYIAAKVAQTTTLKPTMIQKGTDNVSPQINKLLAINRGYNNAFVKQVPEPFDSENIDVNYETHSKNEEKLIAVTFKSILNELFRQNYKLDMFGLSKSVPRGAELRNQQIVNTGSNLNEQISIILKKLIETDSQSVNLEDISKILNFYIEAKQALATTHLLDSSEIVQRRNRLYGQKLNNLNKDTGNSSQSKSLNYIYKLLENALKSKNIKNVSLVNQVSELDSNQNAEINSNNNIEKKPSFANTEVNNNPMVAVKALPYNIIREITEKLKLSVLDDLQTQMSTTLKNIKEFTTETTTTSTPKTIIHNVYNETEMDNLMELVKSFKKENGTGNKTEASVDNLLLEIDQNKVRAATSALENVIELFKKIKDSTMGDDKYTVTQQKKTHNEFHGPINVLYPPLLPPNFAYDVRTQKARVVPVFVDTYQPLKIKSRVSETTDAIKQREKEKTKLKALKQESANINLNPSRTIAGKMGKTFIFHPVEIIQTDAEEVPLLGIPVPKSVKAINQNIVVTTVHPMVRFREQQKHRIVKKGHKPRYQDYKSSNEPKYTTDVKKHFDFDKTKRYRINLDRHSGSGMETRYRTELERRSDTDMDSRYTDFERQSDIDTGKRFYTDMERTYGERNQYLQHGRHSKALQRDRINRSQKPMNRQSPIFDNIYTEYLSKLKHGENIGRDDGDHLQSRHRYKKKYHEKLEKPNENQRHFEENKNSPKNDKRLKVAPRPQLSLNNLKKRAKYDDAHFKNFLKTQEKVNGMLEKILAQNSNYKVRSVETPDTLHDLDN